MFSQNTIYGCHSHSYGDSEGTLNIWPIISNQTNWLVGRSLAVAQKKSPTIHFVCPVCFSAFLSPDCHGFMICCLQSSCTFSKSQLLSLIFAHSALTAWITGITSSGSQLQGIFPTCIWWIFSLSLKYLSGWLDNEQEACIQCSSDFLTQSSQLFSSYPPC